MAAWARMTGLRCHRIIGSDLPVDVHLAEAAALPTPSVRSAFSDVTCFRWAAGVRRSQDPSHSKPRPISDLLNHVT